MSRLLDPSQRRMEWYAVFGAVMARETEGVQLKELVGERWGAAVGRALVLAEEAQRTLTECQRFAAATAAAGEWLRDARRGGR